MGDNNNSSPVKTFSQLSPLLLGLLLAFHPAQAADTPPDLSLTGSDPVSKITVTSKIHRTQAVRYPLMLLRDGISHGDVRLLININDKGEIADTLPVAYTHDLFLEAALEAVRQWSYEPARMNGEPVGTVVEISFRFEVSGVLVVERSGIPDISQREIFGDIYVYRPTPMRSLDRIPTPLHVIQPVYPQEWQDKGVKGRVMIDFYIDEKGTVRMPSVTAAENPLLAAAAAAAVRDWHFAPPTRKGRPVLVHCQQYFKFEPQKPTS
jgi:TonB family protein